MWVVLPTAFKNQNVMKTVTRGNHRFLSVRYFETSQYLPHLHVVPVCSFPASCPRDASLMLRECLAAVRETGREIWATDLSLQAIPLAVPLEVPKRVCVVMGNELTGVGAEFLQAAHKRVEVVDVSLL